MKRPRFTLSLKILLVAFLNLSLLGLMFSIFSQSLLKLNLSSFILTPARDRMLSVSRLIGLQLLSSQRQSWTRILNDASATYPAHFYLFNEFGEQLAGEPVKLPQKLQDAFRNGRRGPFHPDWTRAEQPPEPPPDMDGAGRFESERMRQAGPPPPFAANRGRLISQINFTKVSNPPEYWATVHLPAGFAQRADGPGARPVHAMIVWRFPKFWTQPFFFNLKAWLEVIAATIIVSVACWAPLLRSLTRAIAQLTAATGRISEGHFEIEVATKRRDELGSLGESINRMAHRLSGLVHGQRRFLSDIAHELSSPIARAQLALAILEQRAGEAGAEYVGDVREEVEHMSSLVNELLAFSKSQSIDSSVELRNVNVAETVRKVLQRESTEEAKIETDIDDSAEVIAQPEYLFRSLANLVRNAVRYAAHAGPIQISAVERAGELTITVADQGPGLPENELENVFRPFYRPEFARQRETGGAGLGLAIVRSCIEACGGAVSCRNRIPKGLEVAIRLARVPERDSA
jgi:two-component system sensor histidine kinase CpxA